MVAESLFGVRVGRAIVLLGLLAGFWAALAPPPAHAQGEDPHVLLYTGTTGFRHTGAINDGRPVVQTALQAAGYTVTWEDCTGLGAAANNCDNADKNPRIFTAANLAQYDAILLLNASSGPPGPLWSDAQRAAIISYVQAGGGIAGVHNATDMGTGQATWDWWDGSPNSAVGTTMKGHGATNLGNVAQVQVQDHNHLATRDLPDTYGFGDEHYNFTRNVRGDHHVLATLDERTYTPGNPMGQDHPITWCKLYDGDNVQDGTTTPKPYNDGRVWTTGMGHFGASYTENGGDNNLIKQIVGGVRWVAGEGRKSDCSGTVWSSFTRTVLVPDASAPIGIDVAKDGKVYWSEIGTVGFEGQGQIVMHDPSGTAGNKTTVATIPTRADHGNSEDGVLGMSLEPDFDLADPAKRDVFVYYSPRPDAGDTWPTSGSAQVVGYNQVSRFTLNEAGTAVVAGSERVILRVPKAKIAGSPSGFPGGPTDSGPGHVGGAGLDFDSEGNLYLGVGDDVSPNASGHGGYPPMDYRAAERWDARKTSANTADLRGKIVRIKPLDEIAAGTPPDIGQTYSIPAGNMFPTGTANTRPEIYAMGFRQPFTVHTDPANPGTVTVGEYCHDANSNGTQRAPAGTCEWNLIKQPGFHGWPFCVGDNSTLNTSWRWNYAAGAPTGSQYDCSLSSLPSDNNYAPTGQTAAPPTYQGLENLPGPAVPATIWKKYANAAGGQSTADFGDLSAGGMQPVTGPVYRYDEQTAGAGAFPPYYDGSWFINNRGSDNGFWKEVRLRESDNNMLHVHDWLPYNAAGTGNASFNSLVIGTQFGPDGALYMSRFPVGCCRNQINSQQVQIVKIEFNVADQCETDTQPPNAAHEVTGQAYPGEPDTYVNSASLRLTATDVGCAGTDTIEYRRAGETEWQEYGGPVTFDEAGDYTIEYRATDRMDNTSATRTATFTVLEIDDEEAPTVTSTLTGTQDQRDFYVGSATLTLAADDGPTGSGVQRIEYRANGGDWTAYTTPVAFTEPGVYPVDYRATDNVENTSQVATLNFRVLSGEGCTPDRSDGFGGTALDPNRWTVVREDTSRLSVSGGAVNIVSAPQDIHANDAGMPNIVLQDMPPTDGPWTFTARYNWSPTQNYQNAGLLIYVDDANWIKSGMVWSNGRRFEAFKELNNTASGLGATGVMAGDFPATFYVRFVSTTGQNVQAQYSPDGQTWTNAGSATNLTGLDNPKIGLYATASTQSGVTEPTASFDSVTVVPDETDCEEDAPVTTAALDPAVPGPGGTYGGPVNVNLSATDGGAGAAGVDVTEYRVDGGDWQTASNDGGADPFNTSVAVTDGGVHTVEYRSTDNAANAEETKTVGFSISLPECERSDEFDGTALGARWLRHDRNGGTPETGPMAPHLEGGQLIMPTNDFEIDAASATTSVGPVNFVGQDLPALGEEWQVETQLTVTHTGGWQGVGLMLWRADNNFFRSSITHSLTGGNVYVEQSKDNPLTGGGNPSPEGSRQQAGGNVTILPAKGEVTIRMRYTRAAGSNTVAAQYQVIAPESAANADWVNFPGAANFLNLDTGATTPRRDSEGSRVGIYAGGNFPGTAGTHQYPGTPAIVEVDYFRVTPDVCPEPDETAPETSAQLNGSAPVATYEGPVNVTLSATDEPADDDPFSWFGARAFSGALAEHDVVAAGTSWDPTEVDAALGDVVTWHFDDPGPAHDVWVIAPDEAPDSAGTQVTNGSVPAGGPPVSYTPDQEGEWTYVCKLHSFVSGGQWTGMVGKIDVTDTAGPVTGISGVERTEYRVDGGQWVVSDNDADEDPFVTTFSVSGNGDHTVEYRSVDGADNEETVKSVGFRIQTPQQSPPGGGGNQPPPAGGGDPPPPVTKPFVGLSRPPKTSLAQFRKRGVKIRVTCNKPMSGRAVLQITRKTSRKLKLKSTTLASRSVRCTQPGSKSVTLKPSKKVKRALRKARGTVKVKLVVRMTAPGESPTKVTRTVSLKRR